MALAAVGGWVAATLLAATGIAGVGAGNALTLPAQRHLVRVETAGAPVWLLALQQQGADGRGLVFYRSDDEAQTFHYEAAIQNDWSETDTADLTVVGGDVALVYSYEGPELTGDADHDVYFQWWRQSGGTFVPQQRVRVFDARTDDEAYSRAEIAADSLGRIWVLAFKLEPDGRSTLALAVSTDGGARFVRQADLDVVPRRGGGRLISLGSRLMVVYAMHAGFEPTRFRVRDDTAPLSAWRPVQQAFSEGIYHGAALSAVATPSGGLHLVYKNENDERLYHRLFDGAAFGPATLLDASADWALQPAITLVGDTLVVFYNHMLVPNTRFEMVMRTLSDGRWSGPETISDAASFKGYPATLEHLPPGAPSLAVVYSDTATAADNGTQRVVTLASPLAGQAPPAPQPPEEPTEPDGPIDAGMSEPGTSPPDEGSGSPVPEAPGSDAGTAGGEPGTPPGGQIILHGEPFDLFTPPDDGLGEGWRLVSGLWYAQGRAISDLDGANLALASVWSCGDCSAEVELITFGVPEAGVVLRAQGRDSSDRYQLVLLSNGRLRLLRVRAGQETVLGEADAGAGPLDEPVRLALTTVGSGPVQLTGSVNGVIRLVVTDASSSALTSPGLGGLWTTNAGVPFDDFRLLGLGAAVPAPGTPTDAD